MNRIVIGILCLSILLISGCGSSWKRVSDLTRDLPIDQADCSVFARTLVAERGDYVSSTNVVAYNIGRTNFATARTKSKVNKRALDLYVQECMNDRGWVKTRGSENLKPAFEISQKTYVLMDTSFKQGDVVLRETHGGLYIYRSVILSEDVKVRLMGKKLNDTIEFEKEIPTALTATQVQRNKIQVSIKINGIYKEADVD